MTSKHELESTEIGDQELDDLIGNVRKELFEDELLVDSDAETFEKLLRRKISIYYQIRKGGTKTSRLGDDCKKIRRRASKLKQELENLPDRISIEYEEYLNFSLQQNQLTHGGFSYPQMIEIILEEVVYGLAFAERELSLYSGKKGSMQPETAARDFLIDSAARLFAKYTGKLLLKSDQDYLKLRKNFVKGLFRSLKIPVPKNFSFTKRLKQLHK